MKSALWPVMWALLLQCAWLLPNHYPPWTSFHQDAWSATVVLTGAAVVLLLRQAATPVFGITLLAGALALVPGLQFAAGLVKSAGNAWLSTAYLLGFTLAILVGTRWERARAGHLADYLFMAIFIAAILSVALQFNQWLGMDRLDIWAMGGWYGRPYANFGQPNQLATFLLWGVLALGWAYVRGQIRGWIAFAAALYLLFGVALTASRAAWVGLFVIVALTWYWRALWPDRRAPWAVTALGLYFIVCVMSTTWLSVELVGATTAYSSEIARKSGEARPAIWAMFIDAATRQPWFGHGINQVGQAQLEVTLDHRPMHIYYAHAHNLFLDLVLWLGIPVGLAISACLAWWGWRRFRAVASAENAMLVLFLLVVANHAMLELPLHYAYFLLPVGLVIGMVEVRLGALSLFALGRPALAGLWLTGALMLSLIVHDYLRVEAAFRAQRFEWANIKTAPSEPPDVFLLDQWVDFFRMVRFEPRAGMTEKELQWARDVAAANAFPGLYQKLGVALALNGRPEEAALWMRRMCHVRPLEHCAAVQMMWTAQAKQSASIAAVPWLR
ncbi:MAG: O-antigen ligase C-terminal domain-containing protein [Rhodoferax sp.]|nr:O-antigen ligase C-terminal domain-containing protein [Rhodoferax sp.]